MSIQVRRTIVWVLSVVLGIAASGGVIFGLFQTTLEKYLLLNAVLLASAFIALFWIWLDYVFSTDMLPK
jgi:predicted membrane-bound spermidine synthase